MDKVFITVYNDHKGKDQSYEVELLSHENEESLDTNELDNYYTSIGDWSFAAFAHRPVEALFALRNRLKVTIDHLSKIYKILSTPAISNIEFLDRFTKEPVNEFKLSDYWGVENLIDNVGAVKNGLNQKIYAREGFNHNLRMLEENLTGYDMVVYGRYSIKNDQWYYGQMLENAPHPYISLLKRGRVFVSEPDKLKEHNFYLVMDNQERNRHDETSIVVEIPRQLYKKEGISEEFLQPFIDMMLEV